MPDLTHLKYVSFRGDNVYGVESTDHKTYGCLLYLGTISGLQSKIGALWALKNDQLYSTCEYCNYFCKQTCKRIHFKLQN